MTSPGAADEALTVGSTSRDGSLSDFSCRGPRKGDGAMKPEISAPGKDIVAARAAGTGLGDAGGRALHDAVRYVDGDAARRR